MSDETESKEIPVEATEVALKAMKKSTTTAKDIDEEPFEPANGFGIVEEKEDATEAAEPFPMRDPKAEAEADALLAEQNATLIPMKHPDGGACDMYKTDKAGNILVPASEAASMQEHGFVVAVADKDKAAV